MHIHFPAPARHRQAPDAFQARDYETLPYINLGQYTPAAAARKELKGAETLWSGIPNVWVFDK